MVNKTYCSSFKKLEIYQEHFIVKKKWKTKVLLNILLKRDNKIAQAVVFSL